MKTFLDLYSSAPKCQEILYVKIVTDEHFLTQFTYVLTERNWSWQSCY